MYYIIWCIYAYKDYSFSLHNFFTLKKKILWLSLCQRLELSSEISQTWEGSKQAVFHCSLFTGHRGHHHLRAVVVLPRRWCAALCSCCRAGHPCASQVRILGINVPHQTGAVNNYLKAQQSCFKLLLLYSWLYGVECFNLEFPDGVFSSILNSKQVDMEVIQLF